MNEVTLNGIYHRSRVFNATPLIELLNRVGEMSFVVNIDALRNEYS